MHAQLVLDLADQGLYQNGLESIASFARATPRSAPQALNV